MSRTRRYVNLHEEPIRTNYAGTEHMRFRELVLRLQTHHFCQALLIAMLAAAPVQGADLRGPVLGAASNFGQGKKPKVMFLGESFGVKYYRDGMAWARAEKTPGTTRFQSPRTGYPDKLGPEGASLSMVLNWGNPLYDDGDTPHSPEAIAAFGSFAGAMVSRFPMIESLEVGNEFNGVNFVRGPLRDMPPLERARAYVPLLKAASTEARKVRPGLRVLGGATHSIAAGFLWEVLDAGGADYMDALALHPYTTPAEQFVRQVGVLRRHPAAANMPIEVTEFGTVAPERAAAHFLRNYCQFALGGVTHAVWYPLNARGDGLVPLISDRGRVTPAGETWELISASMEGRPVQALAADPFTYGCRFDQNVLVIWGAPRELTAPDNAEVLDATGKPVVKPYLLDREKPLVLRSRDGAPLGEVELSEQKVVADSFDQFAYPEEVGEQPAADPFERFARRGSQIIPLETMPGQQGPGVPWTPYLGAGMGVRVAADSLLPGGPPSNPVEIVHRYTAPESGIYSLTARFDVAERSKDGISVRASLAGRTVYEKAGHGPFAIEIPNLEMNEKDALEIVVGPNGTAQGDGTKYRITLSRP
ncbi:hypothetical protein [Alloyangia pacifica]|uniref:hypothetical protein n=1 Tax=Alloyangia pacifica TaxID=311180 RepID=UPI001CD7F511|nr:hypothetical protein [Alloyangia pacifica]MCA0994793.1 hypothetical protein [Alloyangia pacifica]